MAVALGAVAHAEDAAPVSVSRTELGLSLEARDASLRDVLRQLAALEQLALDIRGGSDPRVTASIKDASLLETLRRLVHHDFVLDGGRLIVYLPDPAVGRPSTLGEPGTVERTRRRRPLPPVLRRGAPRVDEPEHDDVREPEEKH